MTTTDLCECGHSRTVHRNFGDEFCKVDACSCRAFNGPSSSPSIEATKQEPAPDLTDLRDRFAMAALTGMMANDDEPLPGYSSGMSESEIEKLRHRWSDSTAATAYRLADAMLRARSGK